MGRFVGSNEEYGEEMLGNRFVENCLRLKLYPQFLRVGGDLGSGFVGIVGG